MLKRNHTRVRKEDSARNDVTLRPFVTSEAACDHVEMNHTTSTGPLSMVRRCYQPDAATDWDALVEALYEFVTDTPEPQSEGLPSPPPGPPHPTCILVAPE